VSRWDTESSDWCKKDAWLVSSTKAREGMRADWVKRRGRRVREGAAVGRRERKKGREVANEKGNSVHSMAREKNT
jgi:hypothetical protein